jgi:hypothetical protein
MPQQQCNTDAAANMTWENLAKGGSTGSVLCFRIRTYMAKPCEEVEILKKGFNAILHEHGNECLSFLRACNQIISSGE